MYSLDDNIVSFVGLFYSFFWLPWVTIWLGGTVLLFVFMHMFPSIIL